MWAISISWAIYDVVAIATDPGHNTSIPTSVPGYTALAKPTIDQALVAAVIAVAATALLLTGLSKPAERTRAPGPFGLILFVVVVVGHGAWDKVVYSGFNWDPYYFPGYQREAGAVAGVIVAAAVAWYALTLRDRRLGGALLLGWYTTLALGFLQYATAFPGQGIYLPGAGTGVPHILAATLIAAGVPLTVIYMRRVRAASAVG
jgi:hypothetical protein